jgi:hypothetical protein
MIIIKLIFWVCATPVVLIMVGLLWLWVLSLFVGMFTGD